MPYILVFPSQHVRSSLLNRLLPEMLSSTSVARCALPALLLAVFLLLSLVSHTTAATVSHPSSDVPRASRADIVSSISPARLSRIRSSPHRQTPSHSLLSPTLSPSPISSTTTVFFPTAYGADPLGVKDSTAAFAALMADFLSVNHSHRLANGIVDFGGATIDLEGGDFLLSQPLTVPYCIGNMRIQRGTLRASASFPSTSYLLVIGEGSTAACKATGQDTVMENVGVSELMLDGQQHAAGCLLISSIMGAVLGPNMFYLGFTAAGITVQGGHEVQMINSWLGQYLYSDPLKEKGHARGIEILGNDHVVSDVVIDSALIGLYVLGAANLITNLHCWNEANPRGTGIWLDGAGYTQNRLIGVYMDFTDLKVVDPEHLVVTDSFFLGSGAIMLIASSKNHQINGLSITDNEFDDGGGAAAIQLNQTAAQFTGLIDSRITGNMLDSTYHGASTSASVRSTFTHSRAASNATYCVDLTSALLFPQFNLTSVQVTVSVDDLSMGVPAYAVVPGSAAGVAAVDRRSVCVGLQFVSAMPFVPMAGTVEVMLDVTADQSTYSFGKKSRSTSAVATER